MQFLAVFRINCPNDSTTARKRREYAVVVPIHLLLFPTTSSSHSRASLCPYTGAELGEEHTAEGDIPSFRARMSVLSVRLCLWLCNLHMRLARLKPEAQSCILDLAD